MARCLLKAGHRLAVYTRTRARADQLAADGAVVVEQPVDVCHSDAVITMLADDQAVEHVALGEDVSLQRSARTPLRLNLSTIGVGVPKRLADMRGLIATRRCAGLWQAGCCRY